MKKSLIGIVTLMLLTVSACGSLSGRAGGATVQLTPTTSARKLPASGASAQGYIAPVGHADLAFRTGGRVVQVLVAEGDPVKAGQPFQDK